MSNILPHLLNVSFICGLAVLISGGFLLVDGVRKSISDADKEKKTSEAILSADNKAQAVAEATSDLAKKKQDIPPPVEVRLLAFLKSEIPHSLPGDKTEFDLELSDRQIAKLEGFIEDDSHGKFISRRKTQRHNLFIGTGPNGESYRSFAFSISPKMKNP